MLMNAAPSASAMITPITPSPPAWRQNRRPPGRSELARLSIITRSFGGPVVERASSTGAPVGRTTASGVAFYVAIDEMMGQMAEADP
jgi:hypothetical protein